VIPPSVLPPLFGRWLESLLPEGIPEERRATCLSCPLVEGEEPFFDRATKCCTYTPDLPSYAVGGVLCDTTPETRWAREVLAARIAAKAGVTPLGVRRPAHAQRLYQVVLQGGGQGFGRTPELRCPYYLNVDGGRCGVWRYREAICSTWYCKYERGLLGKAFWRTLQGLMRLVEQSLTAWVLEELDPGGRSRELLIFLELADGGRPELLEHVDPDAHAALWGRWAGREREYFVEAGRRVGALEWSDLLRLGGPQLGLVAGALRDLHARLTDPALPARVRVGPKVTTTPGRRSSLLRVTPSALAYDPLELPASILALLPRFEGTDPARTVEALRAEGHEIGLDGARMLLDYGLLIDDTPGAERYVGRHST
jgi:hypothetical protein